MPEESAGKERVCLAVRLRRAALFVLFALVLLIPKTLALRRHRGLWNTLRLAVAIVGAILLTAGKGGLSAWLSLAVGLLLVLAALLARPAEASKTVDEQGRELGALVVLNGGRFWGANGKPTRVHLFVAPERLHVLDSRHRPLLEIHLDEVSSLQVEPAADGWQLRLERPGQSAAFFYDGFFAEHLARVAETTLRSQLRRELPVVR